MIMKTALTLIASIAVAVCASAQVEVTYEDATFVDEDSIAAISTKCDGELLIVSPIGNISDPSRTYTLHIINNGGGEEADIYLFHVTSVAGDTLGNVVMKHVALTSVPDTLRYDSGKQLTAFMPNSGVMWPTEVDVHGTLAADGVCAMTYRLWMHDPTDDDYISRVLIMFTGTRLKEGRADVADIAPDGDTPTRYYTLSGTPVAGTPTPGIYIARRGACATKVAIR